MRNIFVIACFLFSFTIFSQEKTVEDTTVPTSIFATSSLNYQQADGKVSPLRLTGYKFMIVDDIFEASIHQQRINLNLRNFGRHFSYEDLADNYNKAEFYKFDVSKNTDHYIWNIPMANKQLQKQRERQNRNQ